MAAKHVISVAVLADTKGFSRGLNSMANDGGFGKMNGTLGKIGAAVGGAFAVSKVVDFGKAVSTAASDLNENLSKSNTVFGSQAKVIEDWASTAAKSFGQSKSEALAAAGSFGNMFTQLGIGEKQAAEMSIGMTELASDFASFHNADITSVIDAQSAAFRGEYDALQKFVPTINAAAVEQKALAITGKRSTKELTAQEKALAVNALMFEGAGDALGDYERTSDSAANKQRALSAKWKDAQATLGNLLLPAVTKITEALSGLITFMDENRGIATALAVVVGGILTAATVAWGVSLFTAGGALAFLISPITLVVAGIGLLIAGAIYAYKNFDQFKGAVDAVARFAKEKLWPALKAVAEWITGTLIPVIGKIISKLTEWGGKAAEIAGSIISKVGSVVTFFSELPGKIGRATSGAFDGLKDAFRSAINSMIRTWNNLSFTFPSFSGDWNGVLPGGGFTVGGWRLDTPNIPMLASGAYFASRSGGTLAVVGEGGQDEIVSPIPMLRRLLREEAKGGNTYNVTVQTGVGDPVAIGREVDKVLRAYERHGGRR